MAYSRVLRPLLVSYSFYVKKIDTLSDPIARKAVFQGRGSTHVSSFPQLQECMYVRIRIRLMQSRHMGRKATDDLVTSTVERRSLLQPS